MGRNDIERQILDAERNYRPSHPSNEELAMHIQNIKEHLRMLDNKVQTIEAMLSVRNLDLGIGDALKESKL